MNILEQNTTMKNRLQPTGTYFPTTINETNDFSVLTKYNDLVTVRVIVVHKWATRNIQKEKSVFFSRVQLFSHCLG